VPESPDHPQHGDHRLPHYVYDAGQEPDPRFSLANERTFLAWARTALAILAGAVALHSLALPSTGWLRAVILVILILLALASMVMAYLRWARVERAMRLRAPLPGFTAGLVLTAAMVVVAILLGVTLIV
jgi:putative membrane protein